MNYFDVDKMQLCQCLYDSEHEDSQNHTPEHSDIIKCRESNVKIKFAVVVLARKVARKREGSRTDARQQGMDGDARRERRRDQFGHGDHT